MSKEPLVSVIMPVFNSESTLERAIDSVLRQEYSNLELLVIDNNSSDKSKTIASQYSDGRIKVFSQKKQGVSATRNVGLAEAKGEFICFLDADDELPRWSISSRMIKMKDPNVNFVDGQVEFKGSKRKTWQPEKSKHLLQGLVQLNGKCFCGITWLLRKDAIGETRFNEEMTHSEDLLFFITLAKKGGEYSFSDQVTYRVHVGGNSLMSNLNGLKDGYQENLNALEGLKINSEWIQEFKKRARTSMIKSFLKKGQIREAWNTFSHFLLD